MTLPARAVKAMAVLNAVVLTAGIGATRIVPRPVTLKAPGDLAGEIPPLQQFVERTRGKRFHYHVPISRSDELRYSAPEPEKDDAEADEAAKLESAVLLSLGLVDEPFDPRAATSSLDSQVLGVYNPYERKLLVRPGPVTPLARTVLVHELTHALDDEYHELRRPDALSVDESDLSFRALAEGSAAYVESAYLKSLNEADRAAIDNESKARPAPPPTVPAILLDLASYPYEVGERFVTQLVERNGVGAIDKAFRNPPTTSEQLFHADKYLAGEEAATVDRPAPNGDVVQRGALGELLLYLVLRRVVGDQPASEAARGWGGGRYVAWSQGPDVCMKANLVMDTAKDGDELVAAFEAWAAKRPRAKVTKGDVVTVDNCVAR